VKEEVDYIVVGSGAGGGPLAANLALAGFDVAVLEAGQDQSANPHTQVPAFHTLASEDESLRWDFFVQHYSAAERQREDSKFDAAGGGILYPRCGSLGGCTVHNAMITVYPANADWDEIAALTGDSSWAAERMRAYFERLERCRYDAGLGLLKHLRPLLHRLGFPWNPSRHGYAGWLQTETANPSVALHDKQLLRVIYEAVASFIQDGPPGTRPSLLTQLCEFLERGFDPNDWRRVLARKEGIAFTPLANERAARTGPREYLKRVQERYPERLQIELDALASKVLFDPRAPLRAIGVEYLKGAHLYRADPRSGSAQRGEVGQLLARREVILSGGAFNTPQLLMLSGIGPAEELRRHGISVRLDRAGVGRNLQDRYEVGVVSEMVGDFALVKDATFSPSPEDPYFHQWQSERTGLYASNGSVLGMVKRSTPDKPDPDLYVFGLLGYFRGYYPGYASSHLRERRYFTWAVLKGHTRNRAGRVTLRSSDPRDVPDINFRYFDDDRSVPAAEWQEDLEAVVEGVEFVRRMNHHPDLRQRIVSEVIPGPAVRTRDDLRAFVQRESWGHHASCTCPIGAASDPLAVLDENFRVRGTENLRVVDASVFPRIPGLFIVSAVYMVSEKATDAILSSADSEGRAESRSI
jgi:choline dehydrogenase